MRSPMTVEHRVWRVRRAAWKRSLDLVVGGAALIILSPVMAVLAILIRLDTPGPAIFKQQRVGLGGTMFSMWKFRSMFVDNDDETHRDAAAAWFAAASVAPSYKVENDPRITRTGRFLRRFSLDELPQLFNVMRGDMSLVGPRPAIEYELILYERWYFDRFRVPPGMTGLWQVSGRDRTSAPAMMKLDVEYANHSSLATDLGILLRTIPTVLGK
jgi:lipopolysaccharide/colanic/teichoic acid biosynthesis glycosyltransferase